MKKSTTHLMVLEVRQNFLNVFQEVYWAWVIDKIQKTDR